MMNGTSTRLQSAHNGATNGETVQRYEQQNIARRTAAVKHGTSMRIDRQVLRTDTSNADIGGFGNSNFDFTTDGFNHRPSITPTTPLVRIRTKPTEQIASPILRRPSTSASVRSRVIERINAPIRSPFAEASTDNLDSDEDESLGHSSDVENQPAVMVGPSFISPGGESDQLQAMTSAAMMQLRALFEMIHEDLDRFVYTTIPPELGDIQCRITRDKRGVDKGLHPMYFMHAERLGDGKKIFVLAGRKRRRSATSNYLMSTDATDLSRNGEKFSGKVRGNMLGTQFTVYDQGSHPKKNIPIEEQRRELAAITYETNILGFKGPRKMSVTVPGLTNEHQLITIRSNEHSESLLERARHRNMDNLIALQNKTPVWSEETQSYVLNFHGRVTQPSVKNFQLVHEDDQDSVCLQFGRVSDDVFTCDFKYPLCAIQAFGIALSSLDGKLACE